MQEYFLSVLKQQYADFNGRARRKQFWMFVLYTAIFSFVASFVCSLINETLGATVSLILSLAVFLPATAITVRRLHDVGKSGWWYFVSLIPIVGGLYLLYLLVQEGEAGSNIYGNNPKGN